MHIRSLSLIRILLLLYFFCTLSSAQQLNKSDARRVLVIADVDLFATTSTLSDEERRTLVKGVMQDYASSMFTKEALQLVSILEVIDSCGKVAQAVTRTFNFLDRLSNITLDAFIVADEVEIALALEAAFVELPTYKDVPVIWALNADGRKSAATVTLAAPEEDYITSLTTILPALNWSSYAVVYNHWGTYHTFLLGSKQVELLDAAKKVGTTYNSRMVASIPLLSATPENCQKVIEQLRQSTARGVLLLVSHEMESDILNKLVEADSKNEFFFIAGRGGMTELERSDPKKVGFFVPKFLRLNNLATQYYDAVGTVETFNKLAQTEFAAFVTSALLDATRMIAMAPSNASSLTSAFQLMISKRGYGMNFMTAIGFSMFVLVTKETPIDQPVAAWTNEVWGTKGKLELNSMITIPESPLHSITVCSLAPNNCPDFANLLYLHLMLQLANEAQAEIKVNDTNPLAGYNFRVVAIETGYDGLRGLRSLLDWTNSAERGFQQGGVENGFVPLVCDVITGPGRSTVNYAIAPLLNSGVLAGVPQLDYSCISSDFSDKKRFPSFSRVIPSDFFVSRAFATICAVFRWERVVFITTDDEFGQSAAEAAAAGMIEKNVFVETVFRIQSSRPGSGSISNASLAATLLAIREKSISRIVLPLLAPDPQTTSFFLSLILDLGMNESHIFLFNDILCQMLMDSSFPPHRESFPSSICVAPYFTEARYKDIQTLLFGGEARLQKLKKNIEVGGFVESSSCVIQPNDPYSAYAIDAGLLLVASFAKIVPNNTIALTSQDIRSTTIDGLTGNCNLDDDTGDRTFAEYRFTIQQYGSNDTLTFGKWVSDATPNFQAWYDTGLNGNKYPKIVWVGNTTIVPPASTRSLSFIAVETVKQHPGTILLSVCGFLVTIAAFYVCYKSFKDKIEVEAGGSAPSPSVLEDGRQTQRAVQKEMKPV